MLKLEMCVESWVGEVAFSATAGVNPALLVVSTFPLFIKQPNLVEFIACVDWILRAVLEKNIIGIAAVRVELGKLLLYLHQNGLGRS